MSPESILIATLLVTTLAVGQDVTSELSPGLRPRADDLSEESRVSHSSSVMTPLKSPMLEDPYRPIAPSERLGWLVTGTVGPAHMAGVVFLSAGGTAVNRPGEYGPHWRGAAERFGTGMSGSAAGNVIEIGVGLGLREDPRYFRGRGPGLTSRVGNVARLTFLARNESGRLEPAYARYLGIVGGNFLSNLWRPHSEANARYSLLRSSEGFGGRMKVNAFHEFWSNIRRFVFRKHNRLADGTLHD